MRQSSLRRRTALKRSAMHARQTPLKRAGRLGLHSVSRPRVTPEERTAKRAVGRRSGGLCEACGAAEAIHWHHRINQGQGGAWATANGMHVCVECHAWIGDYPVSAGLLGWHLEPWRDRAGQLTRDPAKEPLRYRGEWVVLGDDAAVTPAAIPERAAELQHAATIGAA